MLNFTFEIMVLLLVSREISGEYLVMKQSFEEVHKSTSVEIQRNWANRRQTSLWQTVKHSN